MVLWFVPEGAQSAWTLQETHCNSTNYARDEARTSECLFDQLQILHINSTETQHFSYLINNMNHYKLHSKQKSVHEDKVSKIGQFGTLSTCFPLSPDTLTTDQNGANY